MKESNDGKKHNIGIVANPVADEGKNVYLKKFINIFRPISNEIFVINGDFPDVFSDRKIHIIKIKADLKRGSMLLKTIKFIIIQLRFSFNLIKISKKIDIVIFFNAIAIFPLLSAKLARKKTIVIAGGSASKEAKKIYRRELLDIGGLPFILRILEKIGFIFSDRIAVESESVIAFLGLERYRDKISIISNMYLDLNKYKILNDLKDRRYLIGYIGRLSEGKGMLNFVKALPLVFKGRGNPASIIGGDGPLFDEIKTKLKNNGLYTQVKLTGWIPYDRVPDYLNEIQLLVFPSYSEGLPNIVSEAMACGAVVVATPVGGVPDLIRESETGFIIMDNTPDGIANKVINVLEHHNLEEITINARKLIEEKYSYDAAVERYRTILGDI